MISQINQFPFNSVWESKSIFIKTQIYESLFLIPSYLSVLLNKFVQFNLSLGIDTYLLYALLYSIKYKQTQNYFRKLVVLPQQTISKKPMNSYAIDPLISETLNLNERRMSHINDILHAEKTKSQQKQFKDIKKKLSFQNTFGENKKNYSTLLPQLGRRNQIVQTSKENKIKDKKYNTLENSRRRKAESHRSKTNYQTLIGKSEKNPNNRQNDKNNIITKKQKSKTIGESVTPILQRNYEQKNEKISNQSKNSLSTVRSKFISNRKAPLQSQSQIESSARLSHPSDEVILQESLIYSPSIKNVQSKPTNRQVKTKQMMNDYMGSFGLKKSKSMTLNLKDICRVQIQKIVAQLTPIQKLQDAEKKMKRIKRRHQNLTHFDQKYYSRLNQMDLTLL